MYSIKHPASLVLFFALAPLGCSKNASPDVESKALGTVKIEVELDDQVYRLTMEDVADGTTLETVLRNVDKPKFVIRGKKTTAFVESIADKATGADEGWLFRVDGKFANRGIGMTILHPPTTVTWKFGVMGDESQ